MTSQPVKTPAYLVGSIESGLQAPSMPTEQVALMGGFELQALLGQCEVDGVHRAS